MLFHRSLTTLFITIDILYLTLLGKVFIVQGELLKRKGKILTLNICILEIKGCILTYIFMHAVSCNRDFTFS